MLSTSIRLLADAACTDVYLISCCLFQADRTSTLLSRSAEEEQQPASGRRFKEDKTETCINFGLDLDLPHPDTYRPETGSNPLIVFVLVIAASMAIIVWPFPGRCYTDLRLWLTTKVEKPVDQTEAQVWCRCSETVPSLVLVY
jgi:hypothetical protein